MYKRTNIFRYFLSFCFICAFYGCKIATAIKLDSSTDVLPADSGYHYVVVGTYTENSVKTAGKSSGIYFYKMNDRTGALSLAFTSPQTINPSYVVIHPNKKWLYAVNEVDGGEVSAFLIDTVFHKLVFINKVLSEGSAPCHLSVDQTGKFVMVANYSSGTVGLFPITKDGALAKASFVDQHQGSGPVPENQTGPHAHMITQSGAGFIYSADLGTDQILMYHLDSTKKQLVRSSQIYKAKPGAGPRQLTFHPNNQWAYAINELNGTVDAFLLNNISGELKPIQTIDAVPEGKNAVASSADIHVAPSGKFLYASSRKDLNIIAMYAINQNSGKLKLLGFIPSGGKTPRCFAIDPMGKFMLVTHQNSDEIFTFSIDNKTGLLTNTGIKTIVPSPVCVKFL